MPGSLNRTESKKPHIYSKNCSLPGRWGSGSNWLQALISLNGTTKDKSIIVPPALHKPCVMLPALGSNVSTHHQPCSFDVPTTTNTRTSRSLLLERTIALNGPSEFRAQTVVQERGRVSLLRVRSFTLGATGSVPHIS